MSSSPTKVIVFGPTGGVGLPTALSAAQHGAKVYLGMRDPAKPLLPAGSQEPLPASQETSLGFERVQADLTDPSSIEAAVRTTGARRAFVYLVQMSPPALASTIASVKALKTAGIEFVVFLSSASILPDVDIRSIPADRVIEHAHAQVEITLEETFGAGNFVAVRPAYFASNIFWWKNMVINGEILATGLDAKFDWIVPDDIGSLSGQILAGAQGPASDGNNLSPVYLYGPEMVSIADALAILGDKMGKQIKVTTVPLEEAIKAMVEINGMPEFLARMLLSMIDDQARSGQASELYVAPCAEEGRRNFELYTGRKPTLLGEYLDKVKGAFA